MYTGEVEVKITPCVVCGKKITIDQGYNYRMKGVTMGGTPPSMSVDFVFAHYSCLESFESLDAGVLDVSYGDED